TTTPLARNDVRANTNATSLLGSTSGTFDFVGEGVTVTTLSFQYISDGTEGVIGDDLAVRVFGSTSHAIIDNLEVDYVPEPSAALLGGIGALMLLRRRRG
ncbi:MAG: hypothetical protein KJO79_07655, partial [Verrucomicrobiae bacterium]|nr:hypothetical protein [Verrucomicrobiae bacterium]NNJ87039.1 hypothetical protein [Akkermansiaceae bacterium]